jgi:hypothetical protein
MVCFVLVLLVCFLFGFLDLFVLVGLVGLVGLFGSWSPYS